MRFGSADLGSIKQILTQLHWLELTEYAATGASAVGTILAIAGQHIAYATAPLSLAIGLNLINRQRLAEKSEQDHLTLKSYIHHCYDDLSGQLPSQIPVAEIDLTEIEEQIKDLQRSQSILENKSASLATKVYQNLSGEIDLLREEINNLSEPFDFSNLENEIESLYEQIAAFANQPQINSQEYEQFYHNYQKLEQKTREVILPCLKLLVKEVKELQQSNLKTSTKLETLTQEFIARPEPAQLSKVKRVVSQLSESVSQLQQTEVIADLFRAIDKLQAELNILLGKFNHRPEPQQIHKLELLITMLVTSVTHLKRLTKNEETVNIVNKLEKHRNSKLKNR